MNNVDLSLLQKYLYPIHTLFTAVLNINRAIDPGQIPSQCFDVCQAVVDTLNTCTTIQCLCNPADQAAILTCAGCLDSLTQNQNSTLSGQDLLRQYDAQCGVSLTVSSPPSTSTSGVSTSTTSGQSNINHPSSSGTGVTSTPVPTSPSNPSGSGPASVSNTGAAPTQSDSGCVHRLAMPVAGSHWPILLAIVLGVVN
ncbi:hypothetical protein C8F01DRAFT_452525 [Mycena amicta]|nr:hypothetical protein C8F01DRAFT_452525 [Mycena amicta]